MGLFTKKDENAGPEGLNALDSAAVAEPKVPKTPAELQTIEGKAYVQTAVQQAVQESVKAIFSELGPYLKNMGGGLTPEMIDQLRTPKKTEEQIAREIRDKRESARSREQEAELKRATRQHQDNCSHRYPNGAEAISLIHNLHLSSRLPGGICMLCQDVILPKRWTFLSPDSDTGKERAEIAPAHKDYQRVLFLENART
jgi:hypothetical protein